MTRREVHYRQVTRDFEKILIAHSKHIRMTIRSFNAPNWGIDEEDLFQEALFKLWRLLSKYGNGIDHPRSYMRKIAVSVFLDALGKKNLDHIENSVAYPGNVSFAHYANQTNLFLNKLAIRHAIRKMPDPQKRLLQLYCQGFSIPDIARRNGWPYTKTQKTFERAKRNLKLILSVGEDDPPRKGR